MIVNPVTTDFEYTSAAEPPSGLTGQNTGEFDYFVEGEVFPALVTVVVGYLTVLGV
jgi:hypothetical protein